MPTRQLQHGVRRDNADDGAADTGAQVMRYDRGDALLSPHVTADGFLLFTGRTAKPGVYRYRQADGSVVRELVPASTLHDSESLGTLGRAPVTLEHPDEDVDPDNVERFGVGDVDGDVRVEAAGYVTVKLAVRRADAIAAVGKGKHELSPGYAVVIDATPGVHPEFGAYDAIQVARRYNHLAIVDAARGGPDIRLRTDSDAVQIHDEPATVPPAPPRRDTMWLTTLLALLAISHTDSEDVNQDRIVTGVKALKVRADGADEAKRKADASEGELMAKIEKLEGELKTATDAGTKLQGQVDAFEAKATKDAEKEEEKHKADARKTLDALAEKLGVPRNDAADNDAFAHTVAKHVHADLADDADVQYVQGVLKMAAGRSDSTSPVSAVLGSDPAAVAAAAKRGDAEPQELAEKQYARYDAAFEQRSTAPQ